MWKIVDGLIGAQPIGDVSEVQAHPLGKVVQAKHPTLGEGEFIYLKGVGSTVAGSVVTYDDSFQTALASIAVNTPRPLAIASAAIVASRFGWYQIGGIASVAKAAATSFAKGAGLGATSGLAVAAVSSLRIEGALVAVVASAKSDVVSVPVMINRPAGPN